MKKILKYKIATSITLVLVLISACDLEEFNPSTTDIETAYTDRGGYESLINYAYNSLYYFYGKIDGIGAMEMGTDLWWSESRYEAFVQYSSELNTEQGQNQVFWNGFYASINYANMAIYYADQVNGYDSEEDLNAKVAEAHFIRGWSYLTMVEQYGDIVLRTLPSTVTSGSDEDNFPQRSTEEEIYELIIEDLTFASEHLPISQNEKGRASRKAGLGMLAKAYLQRTRLDVDSEDAAMALAAAQELIDNQGTYECGLYTSNDSISGYAQLWDGENNKDNKEFLFIESVDYVDFNNPEGNNRGRTRQYYLMDLRTVGGEWGTTERNCYWYGRANDRGFKPTKYLMTEVFEPVQDPADTRFNVTFFTDYFNSTWADFTISQGLVDKYGKDASLVNHVIKNTAGTYNTTDEYYGGRSYYGINGSGYENMTDEDGDGYLDGLSIFTPNYPMTAAEKASLPFLVVTPDEMYEADGRWVTAASPGLGAQHKDCYPSMSKFSSLYWIFSNQRWMGDVPILRLGDIYLIAAEAALRSTNNQSLAAQYVNELRSRAAVTGRQAEMVVADADVTLDFILEERARELAGEQVRWVDLKRFDKLTSSYLTEKNPDLTGFDENKHTVRPIPQSFLDAIGNAEEFGTNGY